MGELPTLVTDLAYILIVAGMVTIVFKRLHQPLVLGYIVAGFLAGPHMMYTPNVSNLHSIEDWSQIGVIFMMFSLGLEFSFKKVVKMGLKPIVAALLVMASMISIGNTVGYLFSWGSMDRLFLSGMLAMSSTTIIYKAFDDLGLRTRKFASSVLSVLILEDILGILLMVILGTLAVSKDMQGGLMISSILKLAFFLILWFLVGVYLVPVFLRKARRYINTETLVVVCVGLCFLMVVISAGVGYSAAFGAFMMGSILSETVEAERIEHAISPLKDLFGAVFFVSVGMLVNPAVLVQYWLPILVISLAVTLGQMILGSLSFFITGHSLHNSIQSGFSLVQIGEFAFIIAALGQTLQVTSSFLYPVVVAVSILTTFLTPYSIRLSEPAYRWLQNLLPDGMTERLTEHHRSIRGALPVLRGVGAAWKGYLRATLVQTAAYLTLCIAIILFSFATLLPLCRHLFTHWPGNILCGVVTFLAVAPCVRPIITRRNNSAYAQLIRQRGRIHHLCFWVVIIMRFSLGCAVIYYILNFLSPYWWVRHVLICVMLTMFIVANRLIKWMSIRLERTFMQNLRSREQNSGSGYSRKLMGQDLHIARLTIPLHTRWGGRTLAELNLGSKEHINIVAVIRGQQRINIPSASNHIYPGDIIEVAADDTSISRLQERLGKEVYADGNDMPQNALSLLRLQLQEQSILCGQTLAETHFRTQYSCMIIGREKNNGELVIMEPNRIFQPGDVLWVAGEEQNLKALKAVMKDK
ncbi:MAG: cation:proton antiporter [Bacteroidaceae bacterium]|nr:cation:proton antiporter [Bacteroidaceae bacterium]